MNKSLIWILVFLVGLFSVSAAGFDVIANDTYTDTNGVALTSHVIDFGAYTYNTPGCVGTCDIQNNEGRLLDSSSGDDVTIHLDTPNFEVFNYRYEYWAKLGLDNTGHGVSKVDSGVSDHTSANTPFSFARGGSVTDYNTVWCNGSVVDSNVDATVWNKFTVDVNWSENVGYMYINDVHIVNCSIASGYAKSFFYDTGASTTGTGYLDNFTMSNLSNPLAVVPVPVVNISSPLNASQFNYSSILFNYSCVGANSSYVLNMSLDGVLNRSNSSYVNNTRQVFSLNLSSPALHNVSVACWDGTTVSYENVSFYIDTSFPAIASNFVNNSLWFVGNLSTQFNLSDDFSLFSYNVSIDGVQKAYLSNLNGTFYSVNFSTNINNYDPLLKHNLTLRLADGHTANEIGEYGVSTGLFGNKLRYEWRDSFVELKQEGGSILDSFSTNKLKDRYTWTFNPSSPQPTHVFIVEASDDVFIVDAPSTYLKRWIVFSDKWMDFDLFGEDSVVSIERLNSKKVRVVVSNIQHPGSQRYQSIGDLNIIERSWGFYKLNASVSYPSTVVEGGSDQFVLNLSSKSISSRSRSVSFFWDGVSKSVSSAVINPNLLKYTSSFTALSNNSLVNLTFFFNVSNLSSQVNGSQVYANISVYNCSEGVGNRSLFFKFTDENSGANILANVSADFTVWGGNPSISRSLVFSNLNRKNFSVCFDPNVSLFTSYELDYSSGGYNDRSRIVTNFSVPVNASYVLPLSADASRINVIFINQISKPLIGYGVDIYLNDAFLESKTSDINGVINFAYDSANLYDFKVFNPLGVLIFETGDMVLTTNPTTVVVDLGVTSGYTTLSGLLGLQYTLIYYNVSKLVNFTWVNNVGYPGVFCLSLTNTDQDGVSNAFNQCSLDNSSGSLVYNVSLMNGSVVATAYAFGSKYIIDTLTFNLGLVYTKLYDMIGLDAYFWTAVLVLICALAFAYLNPAAIVLGADLGLVVSVLLTLLPLNVTTLFGMIILGIVGVISLKT